MWWIIGGVAAVVYLFGWALCKVADKADRDAGYK